MKRIPELLADVTWTWGWGWGWGWPIIWAAVLAALLVAIFTNKTRTKRVVAIFIVVGVAIILSVLQFAESRERWGCVLALLPAVMIFQHAVFLRLVRMPFRTTKTSNGYSNHEQEGAQKAVDQMNSQMKSPGNKNLTPIFAEARQNSNRYFSPSTLAIRYGTPAVAVALVGIIAFFLLFVNNSGTSDPNINAARLGAAGAYVYVLLYLGHRNFRHDVTSGGAMWCAVSLAVGPVLAWAISHFSHIDLQTDSSVRKEGMSSELIYFAAGLLPRHVASFVEEAIRRIWVSPSSMNAAAPRTMPITQVKGITTGIAERLAEEGILDLYALANADPLRLIRNTSFDKRQIISWIDEAILISVLPEQWQALEKEGFTGANDLAGLTPANTDLKSLSKRAKFDNVSILAGIVDRLTRDAQRRLIYVLYQLIDHLDYQSERENV